MADELDKEILDKLQQERKPAKKSARWKILAPILTVALLLAGLGLVIDSVQKQQQLRSKAALNIVQAAVSFEGSTWYINRNQEVTIPIRINTNSFPISGVKLKLNTPPDTQVQNISLTAGNPATIVLNVFEPAWVASGMAQMTSGSPCSPTQPLICTTFTGNELFASLVVKGITPGTYQIAFDSQNTLVSSPNSGTTNIASLGTPATIIVLDAITPSPTPAPTPTTPYILQTTLPDAVLNTPYSTHITALGDHNQVTSMGPMNVDNIAAGISINYGSCVFGPWPTNPYYNQLDCLLNGTPTQTGNWNARFTIYYNGGAYQVTHYRIFNVWEHAPTPTPSPLVIPPVIDRPPPFVGGTVNQTYNQQVIAYGYNPNSVNTLTVSVSGLPPGINVGQCQKVVLPPPSPPAPTPSANTTRATCPLQGTPTTVGTYNSTVTVQDYGLSSNASGQFVIYQAPASSPINCTGPVCSNNQIFNSLPVLRDWGYTCNTNCPIPADPYKPYKCISTDNLSDPNYLFTCSAYSQ